VARTALLNPPDLLDHIGFLLSEEEALKTWLSGVQVPGRDRDSDPIEVGVWFRYPEGERQLKYPFIVIDLLSIEPEYDLFTSTYVHDPVFPQPLYEPSRSPTLPSLPSSQMAYGVREYLPFRIVWQVSTYARSNLHDRYLTSIFATDILPARPFFVFNKADGVDRRTERMSFQSADTLESTESGTKRIFRKIYTVSMLTEVSQTSFTNNDFYGYQALRVMLRGFFMDDNSHYWTEDILTDFWEVIAGTPREGTATMMPGIYPLNVYRGDSLAVRFRLWKDHNRDQPTDLTGATARAQIRSSTESTSAIQMGATIVLPNFVDVTLSAAASASLPASAVWDLEITLGGIVRTVIEGDVIVQSDVTRV
jgi:hypothetical protein